MEDFNKIRIGKIFSENFRLHFKHVWIGLLYVLIYFGISIALSSIIDLIITSIFGESPLSSFEPDLENPEEMFNDFPNLFASSYTWTGQVGTIVQQTLLAPLYYGYIWYLYKAEIEKETSTQNLFTLYKSSQVREIFGFSFLLSLAMSIPQYIGIKKMLLDLGANGLATHSSGAFYWIVLPTVILYLITFLVVPIIIFEKRSLPEALIKSAQFFSKNTAALLSLIILTVLVAMGGAILFLIGVLFTYPLIVSLYFSVYRNSVGFKEGSEIDKIGET